MPMQKYLPFFLAAASLSFAGITHAGPAVEVVFKNLGSEVALYSVVTANEASTYQIANPKPQSALEVGGTERYSVQRLLSPDVNSAQVRYTMGRKTCAFGTTYVNAPTTGGITLPKWNKTATPSGGATCTANITSLNATDHSWRVEFTMK